MIRSLAASALLALAMPALADVPRVAVDIVPTASLTARVMEGVGAPALVVPPLASPHGHALRPSEAAALERADVVIRIGPALAPWFEEAAEALAPDAADLVLLDVPGTILRALEEHGHEGHDHEAHDHEAHDSDGPHDEAAHDAGEAEAQDRGGVDPHAWLDPRNGTVWLAAIAEALSAADPDNAAAYRANAEAGATELRALEAELTATLGPLRDRTYLTLHEAYGYFEDRAGIASSGALRLSDASAAAPAHLSELRARLEAEGIACLFTEPQLDDRLAVRLLEGTEVTLATLDPIGTEDDIGPAGYTNVIRRMARSMADCLAP